MVTNILCVDLEDWYHPEYVRPKIVNNLTERIEQSIEITLELLKKVNVKATFFIVGEIAEAHPRLVRTIAEAGHEVGFHGYYHEPLWVLDPHKFSMELEKFKKLVEPITGRRCLGFRAPSYSLDNRTKWAMFVLKEAGLVYDSSVFPFKTPLYGEPTAPKIPYRPSLKDIAQEDKNEQFVEFPALIYHLGGLKIPAAGGFYLRALPSFLLKKAIRQMNKQGSPAVFSFHPWEVDPETPHVKLGFSKSFITYYNVPVTEKLSRLISDFKFETFECYMRENDLL
jgi:polysaccharide deacetylase family protein (PEP-CTERM system associated)